MTAGPGSLPRAVVSARALRDAASAAVAAGGRRADLRADAYGHGLERVAGILRQVGVREMLVDDRGAEALRGQGMPVVTSGGADIPVERLYGLPGSRLAPALSLIGRVMSLKPLRAGDAVSYGYTHRATADTTVALVTGGYAQGIPRALGNRAAAGIAGEAHPIVGRVAMDVCVVDVGDATVAEGDDVTFFGAGPVRDALADWSRATGMRTAELVAVAGLKAVREWTE